jgi:response regulator of citrate/malate metabolism
MPVNITPEYEKIWKYFTERKTPVTVKQAVKALRISETHARRALEYFVFRELAERRQVSGVMTYRIKE